MTRTEELLYLWRDGTLSEQELREFKELLQDEARRDHVYEAMRLSGAITEILKAASETGELRENGGLEPRVSPKRNVFRERRLRRAAPRRLGLKIAGFLAACVAVAVGLMLYAPDETAELVERAVLRPHPAEEPEPAAEPARLAIARLPAEGADVMVFRNGEQLALEAGTELFTGDRVHATGTEPVPIVYADGRVQVSASGGAEFLLGPAELFVDRGSIDVMVTPAPDVAAIAVVTPHARAEIVGTRFSVNVGKETTQLRVAEGSVRFTSVADGSTLLVDAGRSATARADAGVAFDPPPVLMVDNSDPLTSKTGEWTLSGGQNPWGKDSWYCNDSQSTFTWTPRIAEAGTYRVYATWTYHNNRSTRVAYRIAHAAGAATVFVNQHDKSLACTWNLLGTYPFGAGTAGTIQVSGENGQANADAIKLEWVPTSSRASSNKAASPPP